MFFMPNLLEKKFNEYLNGIHYSLQARLEHSDHVPFINSLLDRLEMIKRNFLMLLNENEDVYAYKQQLIRLHGYTDDTIRMLKEYSIANPAFSGDQDPLKDHFFMMSDLFSQSRNLIQSIYPEL